MINIKPKNDTKTLNRGFISSVRNTALISRFVLVCALLCISTVSWASTFNSTITTAKAFTSAQDPLGGVAGCDMLIGNHYYDSIKFCPSTAGSYTIETTFAALSDGGHDTFIALYSPSFDAANPTVNLIICNDDINPGIERLSRIVTNLTASTQYEVIVTTWDTDITGTATFVITPDVTLNCSTPRVINVTSTPASASYSIGSVIEITVHFSELVWVKGMPQLVLRTGPAPETAYYSSGSGTDVLTFLYTVAAGDDITVLDYWSEWALELNGGRIYNNQDIDADLDLFVPGEPGSLGYNTTLGILGTIYPVYRFYSPNMLKHLFTIDENEKKYLIANAADVWNYEGIAYYGYLPEQYNAASRLQKSTLRPVHRFYSEALMTHLFTIDENEKEHLIANAADVWRYEGVAFYIPGDSKEGTLPVYRFYSETLLVHLFTIDENEMNHLIDTAGDVWRFEGIAYYAYP